jgi:outer membrane lipoprotein-sorting protein
MSITAAWGETEIEKVEINPKLDESTFKLPPATKAK